MSVAARTFSSSGRLGAVLQDLDVGARVPLVFARRGAMMTTELTLGSDPAFTVSTFEQVGRELSPAQRRFRDEWIGSKAGY